MTEAPTHIFLHAGVGALAASVAAYVRHVWGLDPRIVIVEPERAAAVFASIEAGEPQFAEGPISEMGRLDCKEPSVIALKGLARDADDFMLITEEEGAFGAQACKAAGLPTTTSGAAGVAGLLAAAQDKPLFGLDARSRVMAILSEAEVRD